MCPGENPRPFAVSGSGVTAVIKGIQTTAAAATVTDICFVFDVVNSSFVGFCSCICILIFLQYICVLWPLVCIVRVLISG